jgi:hypothetical protein
MRDWVNRLIQVRTNFDLPTPCFQTRVYNNADGLMQAILVKPISPRRIHINA